METVFEPCPAGRIVSIIFQTIEQIWKRTRHRHQAQMIAGHRIEGRVTDVSWMDVEEDGIVNRGFQLPS